MRMKQCTVVPTDGARVSVCLHVHAANQREKSREAQIITN